MIRRDRRERIDRGRGEDESDRQNDGGQTGHRNVDVALGKQRDGALVAGLIRIIMQEAMKTGNGGEELQEEEQRKAKHGDAP